MSTTTTHLGLVKPELTDPADITATNPNWDVIDEKLSKVYSKDDKPTASDIGAAPASHKHNASDVEGLANIAKTGSYNDLKDVPDIPDSITVDSTLSSTSTNPVQNKVVNQALGNKASTNHASSNTTYGTGTSSNYGHLKLSDSTSSTSGVSGGVAATPSAVKEAYDLANGKANSSHTHTKSEITDFPTSMTPTSHNQAASTITAGTFAGKVQGNTTAMATLSNAQLRDIQASTTDLTAGTSSLTTGTLYFVYE